MIGQTLIDMRGRKPAWEGIGRCGFQRDVWKDGLAVMIPAAVGRLQRTNGAITSANREIK